VVLRKAGLPNEGMKLSKPEYLGGGWPISLAITRTGFAAYAQCSPPSSGLVLVPLGLGPPPTW
jgi:hypothetical protein